MLNSENCVCGQGEKNVGPCCELTGDCYADCPSKQGEVTLCTCCGSELHFDNGEWWTHWQMDMPVEERCLPQVSVYREIG